MTPTTARRPYRFAFQQEAAREGDPRSGRRGRSADPGELRPYREGDDVRSINWRAYARHQELVVPDPQTDDPAGLIILQDGRPGMDLHRKHEHARALSAVLAAGATPTQHHDLDASGRPAAGLDAQLRAWHARHASAPRNQALLIVSDLMEPAPFGPAATKLAREAAEMNVVQLLASREVRPPAEPRRLRDVNTGARHLAPASAAAYQDALLRHTAACAAWVHSAGGRYLQLVVQDAEPDERWLLTRLRQAGWVTPTARR